MLRILSLLALLGAACSQTVSHTYSGYTQCSYSFLTFGNFLNPAYTAYFSVNGQVRVDLTQGIDRVPTAAVTPGFVTGGPAFAYPITFINGTAIRGNSSEGGIPTLSTVNGVVLPAYLYMDIQDGANSATGFNRDPDFAFFIDTTGLVLTLNSTAFPQAHIVLDTIANSQQYAETSLKARGFANGAFTISQCSTNTFNITRIVTPAPVSSSTGRPSPVPSSTGRPNPGAVGDPSFSGFRGQRYQIHGVADTVYNIISDENLILNAEFVFLTQGKCPLIDGVPMTNCWSHPGSYFGSLGLKTLNGDALIIQSGPAQKGFSSVQLNNENVPLVESTLMGLEGTNQPIRITIKNSHQMTVNTGLFEFELENSDMFINIVSVQIADWRALTHQSKSHGLLGQTWELRKGVIQGTVDDYAEANNELLGHQFLYNKFTPKSQ